MGSYTFCALLDRFGNNVNLPDLEEHLPINQEYQVEVHAVDPTRLRTSSIRSSKASEKLLSLRIAVKKLGSADYQCTWEVSYGTDIIKSYNHMLHSLDHFEQQTLKVKSIITCYHSSEPLKPYLDRFIPAIQRE